MPGALLPFAHESWRIRHLSSQPVSGNLMSRRGIAGYAHGGLPLRKILLAAILSTAVIPAAGQTFTEEQIFQMRLKQDGLLSGRADGVLGPTSKRAMAEYAMKNGVDGDFSSIMKHMVRQTVVRSRDIPADAALRYRALIRDKLGLSNSVEVEVLNAYAASDSFLSVCGRFRTQTGGSPFQALFPVIGGGLPTVLLEQDNAEFMCLLGTSMLYLN